MARKAKLQFTYSVNGKKNSATIPNLIPRFIPWGSTPIPPTDATYGGQLTAFISGYIGLIAGATAGDANYIETVPVSEMEI